MPNHLTLFSINIYVKTQTFTVRNTGQAKETDFSKHIYTHTHTCMCMCVYVNLKCMALKRTIQQINPSQPTLEKKEKQNVKTYYNLEYKIPKSQSYKIGYTQFQEITLKLEKVNSFSRNKKKGKYFRKIDILHNDFLRRDSDIDLKPAIKTVKGQVASSVNSKFQ